MDIEQALADLREMETDDGLCQPDALGERIRALDELSFILQVLRTGGREAHESGRRATALSRRLEALNRKLYARVRAWLQSSAWTRDELRALLERYTGYARADAGLLHLEYEPVDHLIDGVLELERFRGRATIEHQDIVHLEDTPVSVLLDLVDHVPLEDGDLFCDLGSGLGRATILVHWLTGVPARGIEIQPEYCAFARALAASFGLSEVEFVEVDARQAPLDGATVYYLFTPFKGATLQRVLERLKTEAQGRTITICTYGAVSLLTAQEDWLRSADGHAPHAFSLAIWRSRRARSRSLGSVH